MPAISGKYEESLLAGLAHWVYTVLRLTGGRTYLGGVGERASSQTKHTRLVSGVLRD